MPKLNLITQPDKLFNGNTSVLLINPKTSVKEEFNKKALLFKKDINLYMFEVIDPDDQQDIKWLIEVVNSVDVIILDVNDSFLSDHNLVKGSMNLISHEQSNMLYNSTAKGLEVSGGSAANTMIGISLMGGSSGYVGKVASDTLGCAFRDNIELAGVHYTTPSSTNKTPTARCFIFVTPDAERTMNTFLGASIQLGPDDLDLDAIAQAKVTYLEGYLWDPPMAKEAFRKAQGLAKESDNYVALSLSDSFCVDRHRDELRQFVENSVDILFANEDEIRSLYRVTDFEEALNYAIRDCKFVALTCGAQGSVIAGNGSIEVVGASSPYGLIDTTGAGDLFAAGFLYGFTHDFDLARCGRLGSLAAGEIISHYGARPERDMVQFVSKSA